MSPITHFQVLAALLPLVTMTGALPSADKRLLVNADILGGDNSGNIYYDSNNRYKKVVNNVDSNNHIVDSFNKGNGNDNVNYKSNNGNGNGNGDHIKIKNHCRRDGSEDTGASPAPVERLLVNADILGGDNSGNIYYDSNNRYKKVVNNVDSNNHIVDSFNKGNGNDNVNYKSNNGNGNGNGDHIKTCNHFGQSYRPRDGLDTSALQGALAPLEAAMPVTADLPVQRAVGDNSPVMAAVAGVEGAISAATGFAAEKPAKRLFIKADVLDSSHDNSKASGGTTFFDVLKNEKRGLLGLDVLSGGDNSGNTYKNSFNGQGHIHPPVSSGNDNLIDVKLLSGGDDSNNKWINSGNRFASDGFAGKGYGGVPSTSYNSNTKYINKNTDSGNTVVGSFNKGNGNDNVNVNSFNGNGNNNGDHIRVHNNLFTPVYRPPPTYDPSKNPPSGGKGNGWGWGWGNGWGSGKGGVRASWFQHNDVRGWGNSTVKLTEGGSGTIPRLGGNFHAVNGVSWNASAIEVGYSTEVGGRELAGGYTVTPSGVSLGAGVTFRGKKISFQLYINDDGDITSTVFGNDLICSNRGSSSRCYTGRRRD